MLRGRDNLFPASLYDSKKSLPSWFIIFCEVGDFISASFFYKLANDLISSAVIKESQRTVT